jgi:multidrug efflux pump subunit AcrA (membrane-fusion protein)
MMKKWLLLLLLALVILAAIVSVNVKQAQNAAFQPLATPAILVEQLTLSPQVVTLTQPSQVTVKAEVEQLLTARLTAQVIRMPVREGDQVKMGDLLAQLDDKSSRAEVSLASAQLAQYRLEQASIKDQLEATKLDVKAQRDTLSRLQKLAKINAASEDQLQQQQVKLAQAEQRLSSATSQLKAYDELLTARGKQSEAAQGALGYVRLTALTDGVVAERLVQEGDIVTAGTPIIRLIGGGGQRRLLVSLPADQPAPQGLQWQSTLLPLTAWPRANAQGLLTYEARVQAESLIPNEQLSMPLVIYQDVGLHLPSRCLIPKNQQEAQILLHDQAQVKSVNIRLSSVGKEGAVTQQMELAGQNILCASSDVLLRIMAGRAFQVQVKAPLLATQSL